MRFVNDPHLSHHQLTNFTATPCWKTPNIVQDSSVRKWVCHSDMDSSVIIGKTKAVHWWRISAPFPPLPIARMPRTMPIDSSRPCKRSRGLLKIEEINNPIVRGWEFLCHVWRIHEQAWSSKQTLMSWNSFSPTSYLLSSWFLSHHLAKTISFICNFYFGFQPIHCSPSNVIRSGASSLTSTLHAASIFARYSSQI